MDADGRRERKLTSSSYSTYSAGLYGGIGWSPDGGELVFTRGRVLARTRADGSGWRRVGRVNAEGIVGASWSPNGREIAFGTGRAIWTVRPDGSDLRRVFARGGSPVWSPDGAMLAFDHNGRVYVVGRDGSGLRQVGRMGIGAVWSPDGKRIAYTSFRDGHGGIYVTNVDGSGEVRLTIGQARSVGVLRELVAAMTTRVVLSAAAVAVAVPAATARPEHGVAEPGGKLVFLRSDPAGSRRVFVVGADGSGLHRSSLPALPTFSPHGRRLVYAVHDPRFNRLFVANAHGRARRQILRETPPWSSVEPTWSPDSGSLAYTRERDVDLAQVGVVNVDGSGRRILTRAGRQPAWAGRGRTIAFVGWRPPGLYLMDDRGRGRRRISNSFPEPQPNSPLTWTQDGRSLLFLYDHVEGLCAVARTGGRCRDVLPGHKVRNFDLHGRKLVVSAAGPSDRGWEIYGLDVDGSGLRRLTENRVYDTEPQWSPDGRRIAFTSHRDGNAEIYVMNADGTGQTNLTRSPASEENPGWVPAGSRL